MAGQLTKPKDQPTPYLSSNQQDLLLAALNSQAGTQGQTTSVGDGLLKRSGSHPAAQIGTMSGANGTLFMSPQDAALDNFDTKYTPAFDYLDGDDFDFDNADLGGEMIGALRGSGSGDDSQVSNGDGHEKRKSPDENGEAPEGDAKRQETEEGEKGAKKPGRKPLTTEPTTKRKAQNRAAQRAFRERKEKHLKDLETKVTELSKAQEADKHENGLLKAQVERLQIELREYRKRLSLNSGAVRGSPPLSAVGGQHRSNSAGSYSGGFQFDFPKFGGLPGSALFGNRKLSHGNSPIKRASGNTPPVLTQSPTSLNGHRNSLSREQNSRQNSMGRSMSPQNLHGTGSNVTSPAQLTNFDATFASYSTNNNMHGFASTLPQMNNDGFGDLFSPSILKGANSDEYFADSKLNTHASSVSTLDNGGDSTAGLDRVFQFNGGSISDSTSPSTSSSSQWNANGNSSCGTSPEPSHDSPALKDNKEKPAENFCDKINPNKQQTNTSHVAKADYSSQTGLNSMFGFPNTDYNVPSLNSFDPVLFGDYRESNDTIIGAGGDFTGGFFDDALNPSSFDMGSPSNLFGILQSPQQTQSSLAVNKSPLNASTPSRHLMAEIEKTRDGDNDEHLVSAQPRKKDAEGKYVSCNSIWNQLQSNPDFQEGKFDLDGLCSELRAKAKCSESGVMVDQDHVDAALKKLGQKDEAGKPFEVPSLMFEQDSWDNVMRKLQNGTRA
ncbi:hypothetical protein AC579_7666 [Pseudocercospora musae]|nr:hypothetical protein AC579_7666 [Pseudocercospora musae]KXT08785.1 hypothetical protein AC579_7666 [Pseudocercospora musae]